MPWPLRLPHCRRRMRVHRPAAAARPAPTTCACRCAPRRRAVRVGAPASALAAAAAPALGRGGAGRRPARALRGRRRRWRHLRQGAFGLGGVTRSSRRSAAVQVVLRGLAQRGFDAALGFRRRRVRAAFRREPSGPRGRWHRLACCVRRRSSALAPPDPTAGGAAGVASLLRSSFAASTGVRSITGSRPRSIHRPRPNAATSPVANPPASRGDANHWRSQRDRARRRDRDAHRRCRCRCRPRRFVHLTRGVQDGLAHARRRRERMVGRVAQCRAQVRRRATGPRSCASSQAARAGLRLVAAALHRRRGPGASSATPRRDGRPCRCAAWTAHSAGGSWPSRSRCRARAQISSSVMPSSWCSRNAASLRRRQLLQALEQLGTGAAPEHQLVDARCCRPAPARSTSGAAVAARTARRRRPRAVERTSRPERAQHVDRAVVRQREQPGAKARALRRRSGRAACTTRSQVSWNTSSACAARVAPEQRGARSGTAPRGGAGTATRRPAHRRPRTPTSASHRRRRRAAPAAPRRCSSFEVCHVNAAASQPH